MPINDPVRGGKIAPASLAFERSRHKGQTGAQAVKLRISKALYARVRQCAEDVGDPVTEWAGLALKGWRRAIFGADALALREGRLALTCTAGSVTAIPLG